jgi:hypothetical protein
MDRLLRGVYGDMLARLKTGNITDALHAVTVGAKDTFTAIFADIGASLSTVVDQLGVIKRGTFSEEFAEYVLVRNGANGPQVYLLHLTFGGDGIWRIDGM